MFSKKSYLRIFAEKPEIFGQIPASILPPEKIDELRQIPRLAIGEISGALDIDCLLLILSQNKPDAFLATVSYTGSEYGDLNKLDKILKILRQKIEKDLKIYFADSLVLGSPQFWWALNGRFAHELRERFGFMSQCYGCRIYSLAVRVPLCKRLNAAIVVPGYRQIQDTADGTYNSPAAVKHYRRLMSSFGIDVWYPPRPAKEKNAANGLSNQPAEPAGARCLQCVFDKNYQKIDGSCNAPAKVNDFFEMFAIPAAAKIISRTLAGTAVDYVFEATQTLMPVVNIEKKRKKRR